MDHCFICYDEGSDARPLVKPCPRCNLMAHNQCVLNLMSTHLLSQKFHFLRAVRHFPAMIGNIHSDGLVVKDDGFCGKLSITPMAPYPTNYSRFLARGGICSPPPAVDTTDGTHLMFFEDWERGKATVIDKCPQCKQPIQACTAITRNEGCFSVVRDWFATVKLYVLGFRDAMREYKLPFVGELLYGLSYSVCRMASYFPWIFIGRNVKEYHDLFLSFPLGNPIDTMEGWLLGVDSSLLTVLPAYSILVASSIVGDKTFASYFLLFVFRNRFLKDLLYALTFNWTYMNLIFDDDSVVSIENYVPLYFRDMGFWAKVSYSIQHDFKPDYNNEWKRSAMNGSIPDLAILEAPYKAFLGPVFGPWIGRALVRNWKSLVKFVYTSFRSFHPTPIEIEMVFEYIGYEIVLFLKECYDLADFYSRIRLVRNSVVEPSAKLSVLLQIDKDWEKFQ